MSTIDRVRYYDGEFLRAFDFSDEQTYHMEMRRRLNRYLHLYGIGQGLQLSEDIQGTIHEVSILPGFAIDAFGREIYVFAPYTFGDADIANNRISQTGNYDVWLHYSKTPSTPPSSGYAACNQSNQYTRWAESFSVTLLASPSTPVPDPQFSDDDTDNPAQDGVAVLLGTVLVNPTSATQQFSNPNPAPDPGLKYLGVIAQRIQAPIPYDPTQGTPPPFSFVNANLPVAPNTPLSPPVSLEILPNIFADQNLIVGPDFILTGTATTPVTITPNTTGNNFGNVKIASDLFVQGNIYQNIPDAKGNPNWLGVSQYLQQLLPQFLPDILVTPAPVNVAPAPTSSPGPFTTQAAAITLTSTKLQTVKNVSATAAIAGFQFTPGVDVSQVELFITNVAATPGPAANQCTVTITYTVNPIPATKVSPVSFYYTVTAVCYPL
ncbi:MAG TPA: hypothetical protein VKB88_23835 [Bryobacteraceae bacterium]|nr:hypothetical protein [Bryobacteraceae bacterium]